MFNHARMLDESLLPSCYARLRTPASPEPLERVPQPVRIADGDFANASTRGYLRERDKALLHRTWAVLAGPASTADDIEVVQTQACRA